MARHFLVALAVACPVFAADPPPDPNAVFAQSLAVQMALKQGRESLQKGDAKAAMAILEEHVGKCNGNTDYLMALRDAYSAYVKELQLKGLEKECKVYIERLKILDKNASVDAKPVPPQRPAEVARATRGEDDPLQQTPKRSAALPASVLADAEKAFAERRYSEADRQFKKAFASEADVPAPHNAQWAYSKMAVILAQFQQNETGLHEDAEQELAAALKLAAADEKLVAHGKLLQEEVVRRKGSAAPAPTVEAKHAAKGDDGWQRAQSANFRVFHDQPREYVDQLLRAAEQARTAAFAKWGGDTKAAWKTPCEVYLHATAADYAKATGKPSIGPGHATYQLKGGTVEKRRLDLRADEPNTLTCVLPHETTHLVLADLFDAPLPRWADEGMAVLAEPRTQVDRYLKTLHRCRNVDKKLVPLGQLMQQGDYPDVAQITAFYCESVSVVEFLLEEKGPAALVAFLKDVQRGTKLDAAVQRHYGCRGVKELQDRWLTKNFSAEVHAAK